MADLPAQRGATETLLRQLASGRHAWSIIFVSAGPEITSFRQGEEGLFADVM